MSSKHLIDRSVASLKPYDRNARVHSKKQVRQIADSIKRFGFINPVLVSDEGQIICGHGRVEAARMLGMESVPTLAVSHLSEAERRAYVLADNKLALNAGWDSDILVIELQGLIDLDFDVALTGFSLAEVDLALDEASERDPARRDEPEDVVPEHHAVPVTRHGDLWLLGRHKLICGDARVPADYAALLGNERADLVFTDPPYNVAIERNVTGHGKYRHREFAFATGEMTEAQFTAFLTQALCATASVMRDGALAFVSMDWRHMVELLAAGRAAFNEMKNLIVWNKANGGLGTFYRSKHELIFVFKAGTAEHTNNFGLGGDGRYRTNVWDYPGANAKSAMRSEALEMHPTVKPVALVADAIRDCSKRGDIVLDAFGGSGSTLIAADKTGRVARLIEYDPHYCDTIIRRWEGLTGKRAALAETGELFEDRAGPLADLAKGNGQ
jgi:DNA modification methylase